MKPAVRIVVVLTFISALAAAILTLFAVYTQPYIDRNAAAALNKASRKSGPSNHQWPKSSAS